MIISVIGGGSWGTALANFLAGLNHDVRLWALEPEIVDDIRNNQANSVFLPGVVLNESIRATTNFKTALSGTELVLSVVPTQFVRSVLVRMRDFLPQNVIMVSASKGIENTTLCRVTEIFKDELRGRVGASRILVLAGPSFAKEVARSQPTAAVIAGKDINLAAKIQHEFSSDLFRLYTSDDLIGLEICGAIKNVIALASGACTGLGLGDNSRAALITRGIAEIARLVTKMGGRSQTVAGLAGVGDMVLTCTSTTSRNFSFGYRLGRGEKPQNITDSMRMIAEGVKTSISAVALAEREGVEMPICQAIYAVIYEGLPPLEAVRQLMTRGLRHEWEPEPGEVP
ncbi:MAG TPA: NAD(P)H-dependent glycerol-3-phosphate dehydrogenase [Acidobacteriota bacterium]|nr:NAD(P)H-dependent glycerol-3-phosphate dehydrogenase [Acidobacteriota bacterium]